MFSTNNLRAWMRFDKAGRLIPGTLILRKKKPSGHFKEMLNPYQTVCCAPTTSTTTSTTSTTTTSTSSTTTTSTTAVPEYTLYAGFDLYYDAFNTPGACDDICVNLNTLSATKLYSATPMGSQPTIGMQLFSNPGLTQQWPIVYPNTGWDGVPPTSTYSQYGGGGFQYYGFKVDWNGVDYALVMRGTSWIGGPNNTPVTNYAVLDFQPCPIVGCMSPS